MITKDLLYDEIMCKISKVVKAVLDETLTTFPLDKIKNYLINLENKLNITIIDDLKIENNIDPTFLNTTIFDDKQLDIIKNDKSDFTEEEKNILDNKLLLIGYKYLTRFTSNQEHLFYTPNMQNEINSTIFLNMQYLYHICPKYVVNKIKKNGFCPKSKNNVFSYDPRIHFLYGTTIYEKLREMTFMLDSKNNSKGNNHEYCLIKIKRPDNVKFYKDLDSLYGVFTKENIDSKYIISIEDIKPYTISEFILSNLKNNAYTDDIYRE